MVGALSYLKVPRYAVPFAFLGRQPFEYTTPQLMMSQPYAVPDECSRGPSRHCIRHYPKGAVIGEGGRVAYIESRTYVRLRKRRFR